MFSIYNILFLFLLSYTFLFSQPHFSKINYDINYLKNNYDSLYHNNYSLFSDIIVESAKKMWNSNNQKDISDFISLSPYIGGNTALLEYFSEECERFCLQRTEIFLNSLLLLDNKTLIDFIDKMASTIHVPQSEIDNSLLKFKSNKKYFGILKKYFEISDFKYVISRLYISAVASSELKEKNTRSDYYSVNNLFDDDSTTAWVEGVKDDGIGQWVQINFDTTYKIKYILIRNGYQKSTLTYYNNNRVKKMLIYYSDGTKQEIKLFDKMGYYRYPIKKKNTRFIKILIKEIFEGSKFNDTCISDVVIYK